MSIAIKIIIAAAVVIILPIAWYLVSPLFRVIERDEASPLGEAPFTREQEQQPVVRDRMDSMDVQTRAEFERQVMESSKDVKEMAESMPPAARLVAQGEFKPRAHDVAGRALLIEKGGQEILRFEDFETINGPDLRIYLASDLGVDDAVELGPIRATRGSVNYELPAGTDVTRYNKVLVWCYTFSILFSYAELK